MGPLFNRKGITFLTVEAFKRFPDFLVVKVKPQPLNTPRHHYIVCVIEIKRDGDTEAEADDQMIGYMAALAELPLRERNLQGFLVMGRKVRVFELITPHRGTTVPRRLAEFDMFDEGDSLLSQLCEIAVKNWNRSL
ncbi:hypothetical protein BYT27DRAFT_7263277 [Phlegmacium glaucopus]|nr:hypothetical protein BYT27DRAFT_7263277 [Phlegmacium glaucopus]